VHACIFACTVLLCPASLPPSPLSRTGTAEKNKHKLLQAQLPQPHRASRNYRESRCSLREAGKGEITLLAAATGEVVGNNHRSRGEKHQKVYTKERPIRGRTLHGSAILRLLTHGRFRSNPPIVTVITSVATVPIMCEIFV
jgi:hypothetical protein